MLNEKEWTMHSFHVGETTFTGNSDLSGDLTITSAGSGGEVRIAARDLLAFAAQFVRAARISTLEQEDGDHLVDIARLESMADHDVLGVAEERWPA